MIRALLLIWIFALSHTSYAELKEKTLKEEIQSHRHCVVDSSPEYAVFIDDLDRASEWGDVRLEQQAESDAQLPVFEKALKAIDSKSLSDASALNQRLLLAQIHRQCERYVLGFH